MTPSDPPMQGGYAAPFGLIGVHWRNQHLVAIDLDGPMPDAQPLPDWIVTALDAWFADPRRPPACLTAATGTAFQQRVWALIAAIPAGETRTYGALAQDLDSGARAVGGACRANPLPLLVPCHRVVAAHGLGGFAGERDGRRLAIKRWLLRHEGVVLAP